MGEQEGTDENGTNSIIPNGGSTQNDNADTAQQSGGSRSFPPGCGIESFWWIVFGSLCAVLGWAFTDKLSIDDLEVPVQILNDTSGTLFFVRDLTFDETHDSDTVSTIMTYVVGGLVPIIIQSLLAWRCGPAADLGHTVVAYLVAFGTSLLASEPVKWYVSYKRPNFYELCHPDTNYETCQMVEDEDPREAIFSFPSGHSSTAFTGTTMLALYIHNRFGIPAYRRLVRRGRKNNNNNTEPQQLLLPPAGRYRCISMLGLILPMAVATFISVSRIVDSRHFPADVIAGAMIGVAAGSWVHPLWYFYEDDDDF